MFTSSGSSSGRARARRVAAALERLYPRLVELAGRTAAVPPGVEWMLDNHFVIRRATREVQTGLTRAFERRLPRAPDAGECRVEVEIAALLREQSSLLDRGTLGRRIARFGAERGASLAELWAAPLYLRLLLLERLTADVPTLLEPANEGAVEQRVANCVRSLLLVEKTDWARFVEEVSEVHAILGRDPTGHYLRMDFETRDRYRRAVEALARRRGVSEALLADRAIELAAGADARDPLARHVGYYLLDAGRSALDGRRSSPQSRRRWLSGAYLGGIATIAAIHLVGLIAALRGLGASPTTLAIAVILALVPAATIGVSLINWLITLTVRPRPLAKLDFSRAGVPDAARTLIVVPGLLSRPRDADALIVRLEDHFLATRDPNIELALLTDFADADEAETLEDGPLLERARRGIAALNRRYGAAGLRPFHLFHRRRVWSARQGRWMGWERKRGKLEELNRLLRGSADTTYSVHEGRADHFASIRYVITLDADTILPLGAARRMIETLAHPLNLARFDAGRRRVIAGYTVLQPRVDIAPAPAQTRFAQVFAGDGAFDIYTRAISDVYQDLFGEGVFVGKGIYDIDAFRASVEGRLPRDWILSHDLIEGVHGRAGLVSDIVVYEDYPGNYVAYARRLHRWVRGDWQLLPWLGSRVPTANGPSRNRLSPISRWKILDNLRRSLVLPTLVAFAVFAWSVLPGAAWVWTALVAIVMATPMLTELGGGVLQVRPGRVRPAMSGVVGTTPRSLARWALGLSFMTHEAVVCCDAIARALVRTGVTRRRQLEWTPAAQAGRGGASLSTIVGELGPALVFALAVALALALVRPAAILGAAPLLLAWVLAPVWALWTARPRAAAVPEREHDDATIDEFALRRLARRTWAYFERVIGPEDHWLAPDHFQEDPKNEIAHRTSPTNVAMAMLSTISAHDLGYLDLLELVIRLRNTLENLGNLPRHRGHFYNWFDTTTLAPLEPRYVSSVDSGNLAAALLIVEQCCRELRRSARPFERRCAGVCDSFGVLGEALEQWGAAADPIRERVAAMRARVRVEDIDGPIAWLAALDSFGEQDFVALDRALLELFEAEQGRPDHDPAAFEQLRTWVAQVHRDVTSSRNEIAVQMPWLPLLRARPGPVPAALEAPVAQLRAELESLPTLAELPAVVRGAVAVVEDAAATPGLASAWKTWLAHLGEGLDASLEYALAVRERLAELAAAASALVDAMDFRFLYDRERELLYIGYDVSAERYDDHHYDLLASEARIASLIAIAKGEVPLRHWAKLGRPIGRFGAARALLSWSGTMFEYLMPPLILDEGEGTLLDVSARAAVRAQIDFGRRRRVPWGVSESGYARLDGHRNYQYRAFGVAATGFRRELQRDLVIAPYACLLALRYAPAAVAANLGQIAALGGLGPLGVYEALDFTRERLELGQSHAVVRSYMSHHQGMILVAVHGHLRERALVGLGHRHPLLRAVELLLRERAPGRVPVERPQPAEQGPPPRARVMRLQSWLARPGDVEAHVLGNGRYSVLVTSDGAGHGWARGIALTRPCDDPVFGEGGLELRVRDRDSGERWSFRATPGSGPGGPGSGPAAGTNREVEFAAHAARITVHDHELHAELVIAVAPEPDAELRVVRLTERGGRRRRLTITAFAEVVLADARTHARHPAFSKLFVASELSVDPPLIICRRRPREPDEVAPWLGCALISESVEWTGYSLDRGECVGRPAHGRTREPRDELILRPFPSAATPMHATLDPCLALAGDIELGPHESCECAIVIIAARSRAELRAAAERLRTMAAVRLAQLDAEREARARAEEHGEDTRTLVRYQRLLSVIVHPRERLRAPADLAARTALGQPGLWRHAISGDWPIVVLRVASVGVAAVTELIRAHGYWRARGLAIDLVVLEDQALGYGGGIRQRLAQVMERERAAVNAARGGVFLIPGGGLDEAERNLLLGCASLVLDAETEDPLAALEPARIAPLPAFEPEGAPRPPTPTLEFDEPLILEHALGGFSRDGREYVIRLAPGRSTPAPWINVLANPSFGCVISERGSGYTWAQNAGLNRLTAWSNDTVRDPPSESLYIRDELDGEVWSPLPAPAPAPTTYEVRHGAGYSTFVHASHGLRQRVEVFVDPERPVKYIRLALEDCGDRRRRLTVSLCVEWLLGARRPDDTRTLITDFDAAEEVALARNCWNPVFASGWAFAAASERLHGMSSSRAEFFGCPGSRERPAALGRIGLSGEISDRADACAALQVHVDLEPGGRHSLHFVIGQAEGREAAVALARRARAGGEIEARRRLLERRWDALLGAIEVRSPDPAFDVLCNRWLLYQCVASRLWGRTGFYQSSGGFGFRDQLQDVLALVHAAPELTRAHLLDAASRQYEAGDVQHWWHPPAGQGLRSRCSDDLLWLPLATAAYVAATGDLELVRERAPLLDSPPLGPEEIERYESEPRWTGDATLYDHCLRALIRAKTSGAHELPLIGSCDWNDGFSRVGIAGRGESVWLGWFYAVVAREFAAVCERLGHHDDARTLREAAENLVEPLERAWDGAWYRRAYTDDGEAIGSAGNSACAIDSIAQSWAVIAGIGDRERARAAMASVREHLIIPAEGLIRLFAPAFATDRPKIGYIESYPPGVRENGGQYTHAAVWVAWAFAELGEHEHAYSLWSMMVPTGHTRDAEAIERYRVEPYAIAADIYAEPPHVGRGGWTWYTGAAGWAYRLALEQILGVRRVDGRVSLSPRGLPRAWAGCELIIREGGAEVHVVIERDPGVDEVLVDGAPTPSPILVPAPGPGVRRLRVTIPASQ